MSDFIFELGCEELPSFSVKPLAEEFCLLFKAALDKAQLNYGAVASFATPRRIALKIESLQEEQKSQTITKRGPALAAAFDKQGQPTQALLGFAKSCGVSLDALSQLETEKGAWMIYEAQSVGQLTKDLLPSLVQNVIAGLSIAKPMRWGAGDVEFVRPVHWAVMLYGTETLTTQILGVSTGNQSRGHRFHHPEAFTISSAQDYEAQMKEAFVLADFAKRRQVIEEQIKTLAAQYQAEAIMPPELLDEVTSIVEWPEALIAHFAEEFLEVPAEALIASMQAHQKCFALKDKEGKLLPYFITVTNIKSQDPKQVIAGNEKVMRARLSDAAFFFKQDKKYPLSQHIAATKQVVFKAKLGSLFDKTERIKNLMAYLSAKLSLDLTKATRAAALSKCDLLSGMVGEFPELQGLMGYYYALHDKEAPEVAKALDEQYMPRFAADQLPTTSLGLALSLADRIDTLVGIFALGQKPSGVKDPFKLRRHALAVARILIFMQQPINLSELIEEACNHYTSQLAVNESLVAELKSFILDRFNSYYQSQGFTIDLVLAVRARQDDHLADADKRLQALSAFVMMPEAQALCAASKRVSNLLSQVSLAEIPKIIDEELLEPGAEQNLYQALNKISQAVEVLYLHADYTLLLKQLASLREPLDDFFDKVMVMVTDEQLKLNRLALLAQLRFVLQGVADISLLQLT